MHHALATYNGRERGALIYGEAIFPKSNIASMM